MKNLSRQLLISLICIFTVAQTLNADEPKAARPKQFIYLLKLVPRLYADSAWTKEDEAVLKRHFTRFQEAIKSGQLILAGRTSEPGDKTFGIAVFQATDEEAARKFMQEDPAVAGKFGDAAREISGIDRAAKTGRSVILTEVAASLQPNNFRRFQSR